MAFLQIRSFGSLGHHSLCQTSTQSSSVCTLQWSSILMRSILIWQIPWTCSSNWLHGFFTAMSGQILGVANEKKTLCTKKQEKNHHIKKWRKREMNAKYGIVFYIIGTEGTPRLPKTFDNHPIPSLPIPERWNYRKTKHMTRKDSTRISMNQDELIWTNMND